MAVGQAGRQAGRQAAVPHAPFTCPESVSLVLYTLESAGVTRSRSDCRRRRSLSCLR